MAKGQTNGHMHDIVRQVATFSDTGGTGFTCLQNNNGNLVRHPDWLR